VATYPLPAPAPNTASSMARSARRRGNRRNRRSQGRRGDRDFPARSDGARSRGEQLAPVHERSRPAVSPQLGRVTPASTRRSRSKLSDNTSPLGLYLRTNAWTRSRRRLRSVALGLLSSFMVIYLAQASLVSRWRSSKLYAPNVKRLPILVVTRRSGISGCIARMNFAPLQCIGTTTSGARLLSSATVCST